MSLFDYISSFNQRYIKRKLFRSEAEAVFYSGKKLNLPSIEEVRGGNISTFMRNYKFGIYSSPEEREEFSDRLKKIESESEIIKCADDIINKRFRVFGKSYYFENNSVRWNYDSGARYEWPVALPWKENLFSFPKGVDIKFPWELARFHFGLILGKAYLLTGDEKYTEAFISLSEDFMIANPFCAGVNWVNNAEVSVRLLNMLFSLSFFCTSPLFTDDENKKFVEIILHHAVFIESNLDYTLKRDSSYLIEKLALLCTGMIFVQSFFGKKLVDDAVGVFEHEIRDQVYPDGVNREQSLHFHVQLLEVFYLAKIILKKAGKNFTPQFDETLKNLFNALIHYVRSDGSVPAIGDTISSRLIAFNHINDQTDFTYPFPLGAWLFKDGRFKAMRPEGSAELLFLAGKNGLDEFLHIKAETPPAKSAGLEAGGHFIIKDENLHMFIEAAEIGNRGKGAPGHNDTFSFELFYKDNPFLIDPGTYSFFADRELRNQLRSVVSHNTAVIDNEFLARMDGLFGIKEDLTKPKILEWRSDSTEDFLSAQHYAYTRLPDPVICKRNFHYIKASKRIKVKDEFYGGTRHNISLYLHLHPDVKVEKINDTTYILVFGNASVEISFQCSSELFEVKISESIYSKYYGHLQSSNKITAVMNEQLPAMIITDIKLL